MKFLNHLRFIDDLSRVSAAQKMHFEYITELVKQNRMWAAGPLMDKTGVLLIYEAPDQGSAEGIVQNDPFVKEGVIASYDLHPWEARVLKSELPS